MPIDFLKPYDEIKGHMELKIHSIKNHGDASKEYIALEALEDASP